MPISCAWLGMVLAVLWLNPIPSFGDANGPSEPLALDVVTAAAWSDGVFVGSDVTPNILATVAETGGMVTLYSDPECYVAISAATAVVDDVAPYTVEVVTNSILSIGLHSIYAQHSSSTGTSDCSASYASYRIIPPMTATYRVTFTGAFTNAALASGVGVPNGAHFTTLIGGVHNQGVDLWERGQKASPGTEVMAETGRVGDLRTEILAARSSVADVIEESLSHGGTPVTDFEIIISGKQASVTLASMVAPSPDWFVGVSSMPLLSGDGTWVHHNTVGLFAYDAGTENGEGFSLSNPATVPQEVITSLRNVGKFSDSPIATLQFERLSLTSNLAQESGPGAFFIGHNTNAASQMFQTGPDPNGYVLYSVTAAFGDKAGSPGDLLVTIAEDDAGSPGTQVGMLNGDNPNTMGLHTFTAVDGILLSANTTYHVVFDVVDTVPGSAYRLAYTGNDAEDSGTAAGWSIADELHGPVHDSATDNSWKISLQGEVASPAR